MSNDAHIEKRLIPTVLMNRFVVSSAQLLPLLQTALDSVQDAIVLIRGQNVIYFNSAAKSLVNDSLTIGEGQGNMIKF